MKKLLLLSSACLVLAATSANAEVSVGINLGEPVYVEPAYVPEPGYVVAPDWPSNHYDIHRHRHNDYWARHMRRGQEREEHREYRR